jgi:8-oxo-dGTP pyrophosphatase MutT (NUDIX family)
MVESDLVIKPTIRVVRVLFLVGHQVLMSRRNQPPDENKLEFPGGKIQVGDQDESTALLREILEEIGIEATAENLIVFTDTYRDSENAKYYTKFFRGDLPIAPERVPLHGPESDGFEFIDLERIDEFTTIDFAFDHYEY